MSDLKKHANNISTTLNGAITDVATTIALTSAAGLPSISGSEFYALTIDDGTNIEIVYVTDDTSSPTLTVTRGQEGTSGTAFADLTVVELRPTADDVDRKIPYTVQSGSSINFGDADDFEIPNATSITTDVAGQLGMDTDGDGTNITQGVLQGYDGTQNLYWFGVDAYPTVDGHRLEFDSATNKMIWAAPSGGGGTPGGSSGQIQYNNAGTFGGDSGFTTDGAGNVVITGSIDLSSSYIKLGGSSTATAYSFSSSGGIPHMYGDTNTYLSTGNTAIYMQWGTTFNRIELDTTNDMRVYTNNVLRAQINDSGLVVPVNSALDAGAADSLEIPNSTSPVVNSNGEIALDTSVTDWSHGIPKIYGGEELGILSLPIAQLSGMGDRETFYYDATDDELKLAAGNSTFCYVYRSTAQTITQNVATKLQLDTIGTDENGDFDNTTNYRLTPTVAGKYLIIATASIFHTETDKRLIVDVYVNGSSYATNAEYLSLSGGVGVPVATIVDMNGSTDYVEVYLTHNATASKDTLAVAAFNNLYAYKLN